MAGGRGSRISSLFPDIPKPLIPIEDSNGIVKPVLEWEINSLVAQGFNDIILTVSYLADSIIEYFGDGSKFGCSIEYYIEDTPLGNAGALFKLRDKLNKPFLLLIADAMFDVDFNRMLNYHFEKNALVTLFSHPNSHPYDSSLLVIDENNSVVSWLTKEDERPEFYCNRVNAGLQIIDPQVLDMCEIDAKIIGMTDSSGKIIKVDMDRDILKPLCGKGFMFCYDSPEYCKDMGTPDRFYQVSRDFKKGIVKGKNLSKPQRAVFLDRDGTINFSNGYICSPDDLHIIPDAADAIRRINESGYLAIVITNQPVIARGDVSFEILNEIHKKLETELGKNGAYIDGLYFCPHHPDSGFKGEIPEYKIECECRKPKPGLILLAAKDFNIDLDNSWMIGDDKRDVGCGKNAGCKTVLIGNEDGSGADYIAESLLDAINKIL